jgi:hypothetical protein
VFHISRVKTHLIKSGQTAISFNAGYVDKEGRLSWLIVGLRLMGGRLYPPMMAVGRTKEYRATVYLGEGLVEELIEALRKEGVEVDSENGGSALVINQERVERSLS